MKLNKLPANPLNFKRATLILASLLIAIGCVTVNVNFPESAVQKASDDYVRDLYRTKEQSHPTPSSTATPGAGPVFYFPHRILASVIATANAQEPTFNMSSPSLDVIKGKMKANVPDVIDQKKAGVLGETKEGKLAIHDPSKLKPLLKKKIEDIVHQDNQLREDLYSEVINSNHLPANSMPAVKKSFARSFQAESPSGTWIESENGTWSQKP